MASEPALRQPSSVTFDDQGRCCVLTADGLFQLVPEKEPGRNLTLRLAGPPRTAGVHGSETKDGRPMGTRSATPVRLGIRGTAPAGATKVTFILQARECTPEAWASYEDVTFTRHSRAQAGVGAR